MDRHIIGADTTIVEALEALNRLSGETMTLFVTDSGGRLAGSLTDGDVRRALLSGHTLSETAISVCRSDCLRVDFSRPEEEPLVLREARSRGVTLVPVVREGRVVSLVDLRVRRGAVPAAAVLMAGGAGERLRPLTAATPKPLLPVGGKPVIDFNVELLRSFGVSDIFVAVNYLKEQLVEHFAGSGIRIIEEPSRLGTMGAVGLLPPWVTEKYGHVVVMNADLITDINLEEMYLRHVETEAWLTMAAVPYSVSVPFAIIGHEGDRVTSLAEKPTYNYYANAGVYILRAEAARGIVPGEAADATVVVERMLKEERRVTFFPSEAQWLDIGSPDDYRRARELSR